MTWRWSMASGWICFTRIFKFAPELRFSHGLLNQHKPAADSVQRVYPETDKPQRFSDLFL